MACTQPNQMPVMETIECNTCGAPLCADTAYLTLFRCDDCVRKDNEYYDRLSDEMDDRIEDELLRECHED